MLQRRRADEAARLAAVHAARHHCRLTVWVAILAMLALALLPTISRAMAYGGGWTEICTPQGMQWVSADGERAAAPPDGTSPQVDHCHFCQLAASGTAPLPASAPALVLPLTGAEPPRLFVQAARTLRAWCSAQPRAPPFLA